MTIGRLAVLALAAVLAFGGLGTALALGGDDDDPRAAEPIELRKDDASAEVLTEEDDGQPDPTGDGDSTRGNDGTRGGDNTRDGDATYGDDGTGGGDNSYVAPAAGWGGGDSAGGGTTG